MRISAKARYALAAIITMAEKKREEECITIISLSEELKISKIYLEQIFTQLKRGDIVVSTKGSKGGYSLSRPLSEITAYDLFISIENSLFEPTEKTVEQSVPHLENCMQKEVFCPLDEAVKEKLGSITIEDLVNKLGKYRGNTNYMYYV
ncbi:Rrf2 family transcriptional regulator [Tissierella creatinini]|nr:Rrf2 family transcriptional regulator [Tissierella creatinini]TJX62532.1 Rrf2 family transcriptional regulator [Soehngenia saccharolytica]